MPYLLILLLLQSPDSVTLPEALARARAQRAGVVFSSAVVDEARATRRVLGSIPNPALQYTRKEGSPRHAVVVDQSLAWLLRWPAERASGSATVQRAEADSAQQVANVSAAVRRAFFGALAAREELRLTRLQSAVADSLAVIAASRLEAGDISVVEREQVQLEVARAQLALSRARESWSVALTQLARELAWTSAEPPHPAGRLDAGLDQPPDTASARVDQLPVLRITLADSAYFARQRSSIRWSQLPLPSVFAGREWDAGESVGGARMTMGFGIPIPVWSQRREFVAQASARAERAAADAAEGRVDALRALSAAKITLAESGLRARVARDSLVPSAQRLRGQIVQLYEAGRVGVLPVFDALRTERDVSIAMVSDMLAFQRALADWYALLGREQ